MNTVRDGKWIQADFRLVHLKGNPKPYFSLTGEIWKATKKGQRYKNESRGLIACGCLHNELRKYFPELVADAEPLHLCDIDGIPMHPIENGWYWCKENDPTNLAHHLRITTEEAQTIIDTCKDKEQFTELIKPMYSRWKQEANYIIKKYILEVEYV